MVFLKRNDNKKKKRIIKETSLSFSFGDFMTEKSLKKNEFY
jgi:hypothetical protein